MTSMTKRPGTDRRHTTWTLARLAGCGDPDRGDVVAEAAEEVPADWPVQPTNHITLNVSTCGTCKRHWDDSIPTSMTPAPSSRCPFEQFHGREYEPGSAGARFLRSVEDAVYEAWEDYDHEDGEAIDVSREFEERVQGIADDAPSVYTYERWQEFTDLAAWQEDVTDLGPIEDMESAAGVALYMIAERLAWALLEELAGEED